MLLRMLRAPRAGRPSVLARGLALLVALGLLGVSAPLLAAPTVAALRWLGDVL